MTLKDRIEDVLADRGLPYSHLSDGSRRDVIVWYDDGEGDDTVTEIVQAVESSGVATYEREVECHYDDVTGLSFGLREDLPIDVGDAARSVVEKCKEAQGSDEIVVPITAIDGGELPERLCEDVHQDVWDRAREAVADEVASMGYRVD